MHRVVWLAAIKCGAGNVNHPQKKRQPRVAEFGKPEVEKDGQELSGFENR
jgi:hypothetical protein